MYSACLELSTGSLYQRIVNPDADLSAWRERKGEAHQFLKTSNFVWLPEGMKLDDGLHFALQAGPGFCGFLPQ